LKSKHVLLKNNLCWRRYLIRPCTFVTAGRFLVAFAVEFRAIFASVATLVASVALESRAIFLGVGGDGSLPALIAVVDPACVFEFVRPAMERNVPRKGVAYISVGERGGWGKFEADAGVDLSTEFECLQIFGILLVAGENIPDLDFFRAMFVEVVIKLFSGGSDVCLGWESTDADCKDIGWNRRSPSFDLTFEFSIVKGKIADFVE
jgi:hypothetical protein